MKFNTTSGGDSTFQTFDSGIYKCKIIGGVTDLNYKNSYGEEKPRYIFFLQPIAVKERGNKWTEEFLDKDGKDMKNTYVDKEGNEKPSYFRWNANYKVEGNMDLSFSLYEKSGFAKLCMALFGKEGKEAKCPYSAVEHFVGDTVLAHVKAEEGEGKWDGKFFANITDFEKDPEFKEKTKSELDKIKILSLDEEKKKAEEFRKEILDSSKKNETLEEVPF